MSIIGKRILLIVTGGIAAYKAPELVRLITKAGGQVQVILTKAAEQFVTRLTLESVSGQKVYSDLWDLTDESDMGHIKLSRNSDVVLVAPATANCLAKLAAGLADDLASTCLLATDKPVILSPAMNPHMWAHAATVANVQSLRARGVQIIEPDVGDMACGEIGQGRMPEPQKLLDVLQTHFGVGVLAGKHVVVTSGPTFEAIDPVRFIGNRSSGKQGHAIAIAARDAGARVTLISGPVALPDPFGVHVVKVESADDMHAAAMAALPADIAICAAAVADWRVKNVASDKMKKGTGVPQFSLTETVDILSEIGHLPSKKRPRVVVGFAAETKDIGKAAQAKVINKKADLILANDVSGGQIFGQDSTHIIAYPKGDDWGVLTKAETAKKIIETIAQLLKGKK